MIEHSEKYAIVITNILGNQYYAHNARGVCLYDYRTGADRKVAEIRSVAKGNNSTIANVQVVKVRLEVVE